MNFLQKKSYGAHLWAKNIKFGDMQVLKFGGSSVANATNISKVLDIVESAAKRDKVLLVCSAIKGCTDTLIAIGKGGAETSPLLEQHLSIINRLFTGSEKAEAERECKEVFDIIATRPETVEAYGEVLSTLIIARKLSCEGIRTRWIDSGKIIIKDDIDRTYSNIAEATADSDIDIFVAPGFMASGTDGKLTTLGRGGSDYSAALYAAGTKASILQIWTDVPGIMTTNPKDVPSARTIPTISYRAALDLARFGAKVLYAPTITPVREAGIPFSILNTFDPANPGTIVCNLSGDPNAEWKGVSLLSDEAADKSEIHLVGEGPVNINAGMERMLATLKKAGVQVISYAAIDECNICATVHCSQKKEAVAAIHKEFFETRSLSVTDVYIAGYGAVGKALVRMIGESAGRIAESTGRSLRIAGLSDSRSFVTDPAGIDPSDAGIRLHGEGRSAANGAFFDAVCSQAARKSVFVDCTNSEDIYRFYERMFLKGISIVSSNRRALAIPYASYAGLKASARENGAAFKYDTTVGTAIPVLESLASGTLSSDRIISIEAVVSCTLNYIITGYDGVRRESFANLIRKAQREGLTEKDPRLDLGGLDALRKLLILAREAGIPLEAGDVDISPMLGKEFFDCSLDEFYRLLDAREQDFIDKEDELDRIGKRQRFVAYVRRNEGRECGYEAGIRMQLCGPEDPFYWISGTENITSVRSENSPVPMVLKGSGEGAAIAAAGIINDILKV